MLDEIKESKFLLYETEDGNVNVYVILKDKDIWLTQKGMLMYLIQVLIV